MCSKRIINHFWEVWLGTILLGISNMQKIMEY